MNHNKSLLQIDEVELEDGSHQRLVKIRNPWAQTEWEGPWGDGTEEWEMVPEYEKERIKYENKDDGGFWMSFQGMAIELDFLSRNSWTSPSIDWSSELSSGKSLIALLRLGR